MVSSPVAVAPPPAIRPCCEQWRAYRDSRHWRHIAFAHSLNPPAGPVVPGLLPSAPPHRLPFSEESFPPSASPHCVATRERSPDNGTSLQCFSLLFPKQIGRAH